MPAAPHLSTCVTPTLLLVAPSRRSLAARIEAEGHPNGVVEIRGRYALHAGMAVDLHLAAADHPTVLRVRTHIQWTRLTGSPRCPPTLALRGAPEDWDRCRELLLAPGSQLRARRRRYAAQLPISLEVMGGGLLTGSTVDLSQSGVLVQTEHSLRRGTSVTLECSRCFGRVRAKVVRTATEGVALTITDTGAAREAWLVLVERVAQFALMAAHPIPMDDGTVLASSLLDPARSASGR